MTEAVIDNEAPDAEADEFDTEFDAQREEGEGEEAGEEAEAEAAPAPDPEKDRLERRFRDTQKAMKQERRQRQEADARIADLEARLTAPKTEGKSFDFTDIPDPDVDPIGALKYLKEFAQAVRGEQTAEAETAKQTSAQQAQVNRLVAAMTESETDFIEDHADYTDAVSFFVKGRTDEMKELGYTQAEINRELQRESLQLIDRALKANRDPAEVTYNLAKKKGFGTTKPGEDAKKAMDKIVNGQKAARSLSTGSGKAATGALSYEQVNRLKGAAFDSAFARLRDQERGRG